MVYGGNALIYENGRLLAQAGRFAIDPQMRIQQIDVDRLRSERQNNTTFRMTPVCLAQVIDAKPTTPRDFELLRDVNPHPFIPTDENMTCTCEEILNIQTLALCKRLQHTHSDKAVIGISLDNANEVNGLQFDILLPEGIQLVMDGQGSPLITPTDRTEGFSVICKKLESNRYRLMSLSFQGAKVNGNAGLVLSMSVKCDAAMEKGDHKIRFEEVHVSYANTELNKTDSNLPTFETTVTVK